MSSHRKSANARLLLVGATLVAFGCSVDVASASCARPVTASAYGATPAGAFAAATGAWSAKVANTINDLYSDWDYARRTSSTARKTLLKDPARRIQVSVTGPPCNS